MKPYTKPSIRPRLWTFTRDITHGRPYTKPTIRDGAVASFGPELHTKELHGVVCEGDDPYGFDGGWRLQAYYRQEEERRKQGWD